MNKRKSLVLILIFLLTLGVKAFSILSVSPVPPGWVDTSYHVSTSLDVSEGDFNSLLHPWWHIESNSETIDGVSVIQRNSKTFFYPPFIHLVLAAFILLLPVGIASVVLSSLLYSLTGPAIYFLSRSFGIDSRNSLIGAALALSSPILFKSQLMGFWSFTVALILGIISYSFYRYYKNTEKPLYLGIYIVAGVFSILTHWVFGALVVGLPILENLLSQRKIHDYTSIIFLILASLPFYSFFFLTSNIGAYMLTSFSTFIPPISLLFVLIGLFICRLNYPTISILSIASLLGMILYYLGFSIPFGGMLQFSIPLFAGFLISGALGEINTKKAWKVFFIALCFFILLNFATQLSMGKNSNRALTEEEFNHLIEARGDINEGIIVAPKKVSSWITLVSKDRPIVNPFTKYNLSHLRKDKRFKVIKVSAGRRLKNE